jgi:hypothetical protein
MYNRYIRNDDGVYERVPTQETPSREPPPPPHEPPHWEPPPEEKKPGLLDRLLGKLKREGLDTGDLLLLVLLFLLFQDGEDDELLIALGLLLIL